MLNPRLAGRYAKSLIDLAVERNQLEQVHTDMQYMRALIKGSKEFAALLRSPVVPVDTKTKAIGAVTKGKLSDLSTAFINLLVSKNREYYLVDIVEAAVDQYNALKGIHRVKLTTAVPVSEDVKKSIISKIKRDTNLQDIELETSVKEELIGGFVLEFNNNLVDASIVRDLRDVKKQFEQNAFVQQIR
ncbi:ATP synthase F1 subunit delta [Aridibaculum aurantiacum]|uniref:ATP synthase F1 subunit delta n=1 Tax=Aridibaculum aurantiacum TaxID=2810307 RepID=UPI001A96DA0C|nr:ATP synthase F1 subunit delta [Aridibaculum aurantiacum]